MAANDKYKKVLATASLEQAKAMDKAYTDALNSKDKKKKYSYNGLEYAVQPAGTPRVLAADIVSERLKKTPVTSTPTTSTKPSTPTQQTAATPEHPKFTPGTTTVPVPKHPVFTPQATKQQPVAKEKSIYDSYDFEEITLNDGSKAKRLPNGATVYKNNRFASKENGIFNTDKEDSDFYNKMYSYKKVGNKPIAAPITTTKKDTVYEASSPEVVIKPKKDTVYTAQGNEVVIRPKNNTPVYVPPVITTKIETPIPRPSNATASENTRVVPKTYGKKKDTSGQLTMTDIIKDLLTPKDVKTYAGGGNIPKFGFGADLSVKDSKAQMGASMGLQAGSQAINMIDGMDGKPSTLGGVASGAMSGASMGMALGPWGAAGGAVIGGGLALLQAEQAKKEQEKAEKRYMGNLTDQNNFTSQQTLRNYASHGITSAGSYAYGGDLPQFPGGGSIPTKQDSLDLYNNSIKVANYYKNKGYKHSADYEIQGHVFDRLEGDYRHMKNKKNYSTKNAVLPRVPQYNEDGSQTNQYNSSAHTRVPVPKSNSKAQYEVLNPAVYRQEKDPYRFYQRESANGAIDTRAPMQYYHRGVTPNYESVFDNLNTKDAMYEDRAEIPTYDPIAVKPWQMQTPAERAKRVAKYGVPKGVKYNAPGTRDMSLEEKNTFKNKSRKPIGYKEGTFSEWTKNKEGELERVKIDTPIFNNTINKLPIKESTIQPSTSTEIPTNLSQIPVPEVTNSLTYGREVERTPSADPRLANDNAYAKYKVIPKAYEATPARLRVKKNYAYGGGLHKNLVSPSYLKPEIPKANPYLDPRTGAPIGDSVYNNPEELMNYNQDIMGGIDRDARVEQVNDSNFLGANGVTSREELYQQYPTQEAFDNRYRDRYAPLGTPEGESYAWGGGLSQYGGGGKIHIKKANRGKFTAYKKRTGKTTEEALHSKDPHVRQMANFARNAKKWHHGGKKKHGDGGKLYAYPDGGILDRVGQRINRNVTKNIRQTLPINAAMYLQDLTGNLMKQTGDNFLTRGEPTPLTEKDLTPEELAVMRQTQQNAAFDRRRVIEQTGRKRVPKEIGYDSYPNEDREIFEPDPTSVYELIHAVRNPTNRMATTVGGAMYHKNDKGEDVITDRFNFAGKQEPGLARKNIEANPRNPYGYLHSLIANYGSTTEDTGIPVNINLGKPKPKPKAVLTNKGKGKKLALGGMPEPEYEVEGGEMIQGQDVNLEQQQQVASDMVKVPDYAPSHAEGGVDGAGGDRVFSDRLKTANKKTYAEEAERLGKQKAKFEAKIPSTNEAIRNTGERMSERMDMKLDELFNEQEMKKMYAMPSSISSSMAMAYGGHLPKLSKGLNLKDYPYGTAPGASMNPLPTGWKKDRRSGRPYNYVNQADMYGQATDAFNNGEFLQPGQMDSTGDFYNTYTNPVMANKRGTMYNTTVEDFIKPKFANVPTGLDDTPVDTQQRAAIDNLNQVLAPKNTPLGTPTPASPVGGATAKAMKNGNGIPWQYVDNLAGGIMTANTPQLAKPYMDPRIDMNTNFDINPQLSSARNTRDALNRSIAASSPQGGASAANRQQLAATYNENANSLYAQKNNVENELKNKEILLNSQINSRNNDKRYAYDEQNVQRRAGIQQDIVGNASNFALDQYTSARDAKMDARDLENIKQIAMANPNGVNYAYDLKAFADMYGSDPAKLDAAIAQLQAISPNAPAVPYLINLRKNITGK